MYQRNKVSPDPIAIGAVVQISDGAVQTSGVTVRIKPVGVAEADGAGTTAYSTDGVVYYTPTQAETDYSSFILIAKKTGCLPASVTVTTVNYDPQSAAWNKLITSANEIYLGTASGTPNTTTMAASTFASTADNHWNGRIIIWTSGVLAGQATDITGYVDSTRTFTFTAVTTGATAGDTFIIV